MRFGRKKRKPYGLVSRLFRSLLAIVILTAFVLGVTLTTKELALLDVNSLATTFSPVLSKFGLSEEKTGEVAGEFVDRFAQTGINKSPEVSRLDEGNYSEDGNTLNESQKSNPKNLPETSDILTSSDARPEFRVALMSDVHEDWENFEKALTSAKELDVDYVFYLGDLTDWGDKENLAKGKELLENSGMKWEILPGDHDLAQSASRNGGNGLDNFMELFGDNYTLVTVGDRVFMLFDNSANFTPLDETRFSWYLNNINSVDFLILSQPIYHSQSKILMGIVDGEEVEDVANQRRLLLGKVQGSKAKAVFAADHHRSSVSVDPVRSTLKHFVVGALTTRRNLQSPRFSILNIFEDGSYNVEEVTI